MKKLFLLLTVCIMAVCSFAASSYIDLTSGHKLVGSIIMYTDSDITFMPEGAFQTMTIPVSRVQQGRLENGSQLMVENGKIVVRSKDELKYMKEQANYAKLQSPNYAIGKALKSAGSVSLAIGVPVFAAGLATCIAGNVGGTKYNLLERAQCAEASYYLFGAGAAMTIIGIPLYVHGNKLLEMHFKYSGNGAGVAVNF